MARTVTPRGFVTYDEFPDSRGSKITIRESSAASGPHVWIFCEPAYPEGEPHLTVGQARRVRDALDAFIAEKGET